jgi:hypothetical protein
MSDTSKQKSAAERALQLKRQAAGKAAGPDAAAGRREALTAAAARSASKSKPWMKR